MLVGIDTNTLIWLVPHPTIKNKKQSAREAEMKRRARVLMDNLNHRDDVDAVAISSVSVTEFLVAIPEEKHGNILAALDNQFALVTFDHHSSSLAATLLAGLARKRDKSTPGKPGEKQQRFADAQIVASLKAFGCKEFYSDDEGARELANQLGILAFDLPTRSSNLFFDTLGAELPIDEDPK